MKKTKGALTTTERQVIKNKKTIVVLFLVLAISIAINVIYVSGVSEKIIKYKVVKVEENDTNQQDIQPVVEDKQEDTKATESTIENAENDSEVNDTESKDDSIEETTGSDDEVAEEKSEKTEFDADTMLDSLYSFDDEEFKTALREDYDNAETYKTDFKDSYHFVVKYEKEEYTFGASNDYVSFDANNKHCKFSKEKIDGLHELIGKNELRVCSLHSYVNDKGIVVDVYEPNSYIYGPGGDYNSYTYYPPENMDEIVEYCRELKALMME